MEYSSSGDKIITSASSFELKKYGYNGSKGNLPAAYLVGYLAGKKSKEKKVTEIILDSGLYKSVKGSRIYSLLKGCIDAGLSIPCSEEILPSEDRINGKHIKNFDQKNFAESKKKVTEE